MSFCIDHVAFTQMSIPVLRGFKSDQASKSDNDLACVPFNIRDVDDNTPFAAHVVITDLAPILLMAGLLTKNKSLAEDSLTRAS